MKLHCAENAYKIKTCSYCEMSVNLVIKYVYGGSKDDITKAGVHQVSQERVSKYFKDHAIQTVVKYQNIIDLLKSDGAQFYPNSVRYYDPYSEAYFRMEKDFTLELSRSSSMLSIGAPLILRLWIKGANFTLRSRITALNQRMKQFEQQLNCKFHRSDSAKSGLTLSKPPANTMGYLSPATKPIDLRYSFGPMHPNISFDLNQSLSIRPEEYRRDRRDSGSGVPMPSLGRYSEGSLYPDYYYPPSYPSRLSINAKLDIAIMYAEPLARTDGKGVYSLPDAVDYEEECNKIYETLERKEMRIHLGIEIASRENLVKVLSSNPVILHILCHGEYDKQKGKFFLCFENSNGELDPIFAEDLKDILGRVNTDIKLVFVNACHSEPVARVFTDAGIPCVIAVQSQLQIADAIARKFAQEFYNFIFDGYSIGTAFNNALVASKSPESRSCCCGHQHKQTCKWYRMAIQEDYHQAHLLHDPVCLECPRKSEHIHKMGCRWADQFMMTFGPDGWFNVELEFKTCCCEPDLPHDEVLKFIKLSQNPEESDKLVLYEPKDKGRLEFRKQNSVIEQKFPVKRLIGRNKIMYDLLKTLRGPSRFIKLVGKGGVGKTVLAKQMANYLHARNFFRNKIAILNMDKFYSLSSFLSELYSEEEFVNDIKGFCEAMKSKDALFILEKCDGFLRTHMIEFVRTLTEIADLTKSVKFLLILNQPLDLGLKEVTLEVGNLYPVDAAKLLLANTPMDKIPMKYRNIEELRKSDLFVNYKTISPQVIWLISTRLMKGQSFDKIQRELIKELGTVSEDSQCDHAIEKTLREIQLQDKQACALIVKLGVFPGGLASLDLRELVRFGFISDDWRTTLSNLFPKETQDQTPQGKTDAISENRSFGPGTPKPGFKHSPSQLMDQLSINTGDFLWIQINKIPSIGGLLFKPSQAVHQFLLKELQQETQDAEFLKLEYLTLLSVSLLAKIRSLSVYNERLMENSAVCRHGLWEIAEDNTFYNKYLKDRSVMLSYLEGSNIKTAKDILNIYNIHEPNLQSSLNIAVIKSRIANLETRKETLDLIEILWLAVITLYKIFSKQSEAVISFASKVLGLLNELDVKGSQIALLKIKVHLFIIAVTLKRRKNDANPTQQYNDEVGLIRGYITEITEQDIIQRINFEVKFAEAYLYYRLRTGKYHRAGDSMLDEGQTRFHHVIKILQNYCDPTLKSLGFRTDFDGARVALLVCKIRNRSNKGTIDKTFKDRLLNGVKEFQRATSLKLALQTHYSIAKLHRQ